MPSDLLLTKTELPLRKKASVYVHDTNEWERERERENDVLHKSCPSLNCTITTRKYVEPRLTPRNAVEEKSVLKMRCMETKAQKEKNEKYELQFFSQFTKCKSITSTIMSTKEASH